MTTCASWQLVLKHVDGPKGLAPKPKHLQAALSQFLSHDGQQHAWSVGQLMRVDEHHALLSVNTLNHSESRKLIAGIQVGVQLRLGSNVFVVAEPPQLVDQWDAVALPQVPTAGSRWVITFRTPTLFSRNRAYSLWPAPHTMLGSLTRSWTNTYGSPWELEEMPVARLASIQVTDVELWSVDVDFGYDQAKAIQGWVELTAGSDLDVNRRALHLLRWAEFAGMGARTTHGCGSVSVEFFEFRPRRASGRRYGKPNYGSAELRESPDALVD